MSQEALVFLVEAMQRLRPIVMMVETGKKYVPAVAPEPVDVKTEEIRAAITRFLAEYEKRGFAAAKEAQAAFEKEAEGMPQSFFRGSRENSPVLILNAHLNWIDKHSQMKDWDVRKALLADMPSLWSDIMRDLKRAL